MDHPSEAAGTLVDFVARLRTRPNSPIEEREPLDELVEQVQKDLQCIVDKVHPDRVRRYGVQVAETTRIGHTPPEAREQYRAALIALLSDAASSSLSAVEDAPSSASPATPVSLGSTTNPNSPWDDDDDDDDGDDDDDEELSPPPPTPEESKKRQREATPYDDDADADGEDDEEWFPNPPQKPVANMSRKRGPPPTPSPRRPGREVNLAEGVSDGGKRRVSRRLLGMAPKYGML